MDELVDIRDAETGKPTGGVVWKSEAHRRGLWHRCIHCWIFGVDAGEPYLLVQRRAATKDTWAGYVDLTAGGHLATGEEPLDGLREVEAVLRIALDDAEALGAVGSAPTLEYRDGRVSETRVRVSDFVPNSDDYLRRVAVAARAALDGGRVERIF